MLSENGFGMKRLFYRKEDQMQMVMPQLSKKRLVIAAQGLQLQHKYSESGHMYICMVSRTICLILFRGRKDSVSNMTI